MISKIDSLKKFGIYKNFNWNSSNEIADFKDKNIIYGWNYSGKTTLSRVFSSLRDKELFVDYDNCDFKISTINNGSFTKSNIEDFPFKILVFNSDYVKDNLRWGIDDKINAIYFQVGENAKNAKKVEELENLIIGINGNDSIKGKKEPFLSEITEFENFDGSLFTNESRRIKNDVFSSLIEFDKRKFKKQIPLVLQNLNGFIVNKTILTKLSKTVKIEEPKQEIDLIKYELNINEIISEVNELLIKEPNKTNVISILESNATNLDWTKKGLEINKANEKCLFCDNTVTQDRIELLNKFYNNASSKLRESSKEMFKKLEEEKLKITEINFPNSTQDINEGYQGQYSKKKSITDKKLNGYLKKLTNIKKELSLKIDKNLYNKVDEIAEFNLTQLDNELKDINEILKENNNFSKNFSKIINSERQKFINHLVAKFLKEQGYSLKEKKYNKALVEVEKLETKIKSHTKEITRINALKDSVEEGCLQFNSFVQSFLGKEDIEIKYNKVSKTFNLFRGTEIAKNLSEGEKMAISFSHFMVTLRSIESDGKLRDSIIFIDDPMSSLDGNHIFQINAILKDFFYNEIPNPEQPAQKMWTQKCLQLFISTHNFEFFNLLKEMPTSRGFRYSLRKEKGNESRYFVSRKINESQLEKLPIVYDTYKSEYHFLFKEIYDFKNDPNNSSSDKLLLIPNILRRFLEMYTLTKYPSQDEVDKRADKIFGKLKSKKICKPFHHFSHFNNIDRIGKQSELLANINSSCNTLIDYIEKEDEMHFSALKSIL
jgi:wobble nucleotide-excising tRNase